MGITERHWFEDEEPELTEQQLEDIVAENQRNYKKGYADAMKNAVPKTEGWVSVKDRIPEEDTDVLAWNELGIEIAAYTTNPVKRWYSYTGNDVFVKYWMPLPEPPEEEDHEAD